MCLFLDNKSALNISQWFMIDRLLVLVSQIYRSSSPDTAQALGFRHQQD